MESGEDLDELALAARDGDRTAVSALLRAIQPRVARYCRARVGGRLSTYASADDITQEVLIAVMQALPSYRPDRSAFTSFMFGIASHKVADFYRKRQREPTTPMDDLPITVDIRPGPEAVALQADERQRLEKLLEGLTESQRNILVLRLVAGLSADETARAIGSTPASVRVTQHRALEKLRRVLTSQSCAA
ncbi:RNA polymerase sigma factor ShbA [Prauserella alba]|uniref:Sigma-70 family RNA polymerase sigma factor n=1 Tax=Prauserella alba TaxID=176898 RepID=A0ABP4G7K2_9PSEU|nr:RNA polymerase sigma factor ShbA [Prauserella alba]MCP2180861.1 RNA polymerase sigma-70 factor, ECF subfamily [Prauserella alba]